MPKTQADKMVTVLKLVEHFDQCALNYARCAQPRALLRERASYETAKTALIEGVRELIKCQ